MGVFRRSGETAPSVHAPHSDLMGVSEDDLETITTTALPTEAIATVSDHEHAGHHEGATRRPLVEARSSRPISDEQRVN